MLEFLYCGEYSLYLSHAPGGPALTDAENHKQILEIHVRLYILGDKYRITALRSVAAYEFCEDANRSNDLSAVLCCIPLIYGNIPENDHLLRKAILRYLEHHFIKNPRWDCFEAELSELVGNIEPFRIDADRAYMDGRLSLLHAGFSAMEQHA